MSYSKNITQFTPLSPQQLSKKYNNSEKHLRDMYFRFLAFHNNPINFFIHAISVPIFSASILQIIFSYQVAIYGINISLILSFISIVYYFYLDSIFSLLFVGLTYGMTLLWNYIINLTHFRENISFFWILIGITLILQVIGHKIFQKKTPTGSIYTPLQFIQNPFIIFIRICKMLGNPPKCLKPRIKFQK